MELWEHGLSILLSGGVFAALFRILIIHWLDDIKGIPIKLNEIDLKIATISTKLENFDKISEVTQEHDRDIALLKSKVYGYKRQ